jgi:hypothetical protein
MSTNTPFVFDGSKAILRYQEDFSNTSVTTDKGRMVQRSQYIEKKFGLVIFLDALGIKGIWARVYPKQVLERWGKTYYIFSDALDKMPGLELSVFSDTLIISSAVNTNLRNNPRRFVELIASLLVSPFVNSIYYRIFLRGVISVGEFYRSSRMLIGPAVDEAVQYFDLSNWIGLSISPITSKILDDYGMENSRHLVKYRIPYKGFVKTYWVLDSVKHEIRKDSEQNSK